MTSPATHWVKESPFGIWFLNTDMWQQRVLKRALDELDSLLPADRPGYAAILDIGCGRGHAFRMLDQRFHPARICAIEIDEALIGDAVRQAEHCSSPVTVTVGNAEALPYPDQAFDMVFCHQSFHHIVRHEKAIDEFYRVLKPGGTLLFAESCRKFIHSFLIRLLFRHPMHVQKTSDEYIALIRQAGFKVDRNAISTPYLWWSRPDVGALEWFGFGVPENREETLLNLVAVKGL
ncbi:MAG: class I SAM-dependent methyltransferase [Methylobacter sp.]|uniref:class I SAM-dependent methyltransferase n=1 Tax=Methylobacter sp. TaxID=2051955 RepID=UPI0025869509|nr:class I SAM-dependent methyltransferase [Methylobacter sp.]MCL7423168.1 class I SAM-dependent methyltransferase [Methylobacter sp.]